MAKSSTNTKRLLGCFLLVLLASIILIFLPDHPPSWIERRIEQFQDWKRVQAVGGWAALKRDCNALASKYKSDDFGFRWWRDDTNSIPPTIAALKPRMVEFLSPEFRRQLGMNEIGSEAGKRYGTNLVVRIIVVEDHSTGGHERPFLGLDVLCEPGVTNYNPVRPLAWAPLEHWKYRKIADDVYEFYY